MAKPKGEGTIFLFTWITSILGGFVIGYVFGKKT